VTNDDVSTGTFTPTGLSLPRQQNLSTENLSTDSDDDCKHTAFQAREPASAQLSPSYLPSQQRAALLPKIELCLSGPSEGSISRSTE
jgi:hypothetical protein